MPDCNADDPVLDCYYTFYTETGFTDSLVRNQIIFVSVGNIAGDVTITIQNTDLALEFGLAPGRIIEGVYLSDYRSNRQPEHDFEIKYSVILMKRWDAS